MSQNGFELLINSRKKRKTVLINQIAWEGTSKYLKKKIQGRKMKITLLSQC